jgi:signal transduction histidine kinase
VSSFAAETAKLRLSDVMNKELLIVSQLVNTPSIQAYFQNPTDKTLEEKAFAEFDTYAAEYSGEKQVFWVNDIDKIFYSSYASPYKVDPNLTENYWYNMTVHNTELYNFNVNYNPDIDTLALWINAPVYSETTITGDPKTTGMLGTGINLSEFISELYSNIDENANIYLFNHNGEVTIAENLQKDINKSTIQSLLGEPGKDVYRKALEIDHDNAKQVTFTEKDAFYLVDYIPALDWFVAVEYPINATTLFDNSMTMVFVIMLLVIFAVIFLSNIFISYVAKALEQRNNQLIEANKKAKVASKEKGDFLAKMSHEIRTPMNAIIGMGELISREDIPDNARQQLEKLRRAGKGLLSIINDILDFSKIESGKLEIIEKPFRLGTMLSDVMTMIDLRAETNNLNFVKDISIDIPEVITADEGRLRQILLNLLTNAVKYTREGKVTLRVLAEYNKDDTKCKLTIIVSDTGIGIAEKDLPKLFGTFAQFDSKKNVGIEGTGLGLAIAKNLCIAMNGDITVESKYGKGSTFTATMLVKCGGRVIEERTEKLDSTIEFTAPDAKILVVDDLEINLEIAKELLTIMEINADTAQSGVEALDKCKKTQYDLILMDHMMPGMDGIETTSAIRSMENYTKTPIIALTANAVSGVKEMFLQNGFSDFISKPIDINNLIQTVKTWL